MDVTKAIGYRGIDLNTVVIDSEGMYGTEIKRVEYPGVQGIGYDEKRAQADGYDSSDVYLSKRLIGLGGATYGRTRGEAFDRLQEVITALTPTAAYDDSPGDRGFLPLDFYVPTSDLANFPLGYIHRMVLARPARQPSVTYVSDESGGNDDDPLALTWTGLLECRDPRVYAYIPTDTAIDKTKGSKAGSFINLGDYPAPLNLLLVVAAGSGAGNFHLVGAGTDMRINIEAQTYEQTYRYSASTKVLTVEINNVETLRMDLLHFLQQTTHPLVPVGTSAYSWTKGASVNLGDDCRMWHWDAWA